MRIRVSGLLLEVDHLPAGFPAADGPGDPDVKVVLGHLGPFRERPPAAALAPLYESLLRDEAGRPLLRVDRLPSGHYWLRFADRQQFLIDAEGTEVHGTWSSPSTVEHALAMVFGPVLGFLLRLRGVVSLHGSAFVVGGRAVVIAGGQGAGKSTTAAALARHGLPVLCDDIAALIEGDGSFRIAPGIPRLMLLPESVRALGDSPDRLPRLAPDWEKSCLDLTGPGLRSCREPMPLGAIYVLGPRDAERPSPTFRDVSGAEALVEMVTHSYANRLLDGAMRARDFEVLTRLVPRVPVRRVHPPSGLDKLGALVDGLLEDCRSMGIG